MRAAAWLFLLLVLTLVPVGAAGPVDLDVSAPMTEATVKPQTVVAFPVNVTNLGSDPVRVTFEVTRAPRNLQVPVPHPLVIEPGERTSIAIMAQTPYRNGRVDESDSFQVTFTPTRGGVPYDAEASAVTFIVHTVGLYVPGGGTALALAACVFGAAFRRR